MADAGHEVWRGRMWYIYIYIYPLIASLISVPHRLKDSRQDCLLLLLFDSFFHDQDSRQTWSCMETGSR
jgi:hypothetical protein